MGLLKEILTGQKVLTRVVSFGATGLLAYSARLLRDSEIQDRM